MRIGIVTDNYFPSIGGTEISISSYAKQLESQGHTVFIFCPSQGRKNPKREPKNTIRLPSIRGIYPDHPIMFTYPGITKRFASHNLDIIHSQTPICAPYISNHISKKLGIPHIHTMHTLVPEQIKSWNSGLLRMLILYIIQSIILKTPKLPPNYITDKERKTMAIKVRLSWIYILRTINLADKLIVPSKHVRRILRSRGCNNKIEVLPTFSNMSFKNTRKISRKKLVKLIYVGRLDKEKRPSVLIQMARRLPKNQDWRLTIVGNGTQKARMRFLIRRYKLNKRVVLRGRLSQRQIAKELRKSDIFILPSYRFDTQGIVLLEACAAGLPIVYCDNHLSVGVEESNSILTKPDADSMSEGVRKLISNRRLRQRLAKNSLEVNKKYLPDLLTENLVSIYSRTINSYKRQQKIQA